jgi:multidrug efflux system membrane fusion protein
MQNFKYHPAAQAIPAGIQDFRGAITRIDPRWRLILGSLGALLLLGLVWWLVSSGEQSGGHHAPAPPVVVSKVQVRNVSVSERTIGTVLANTTVQVTAQVTGQLLAVGFKEGQIVHQGDLLFQLDPKPFQAALAQAQAALARDQATLISDRNDAARYLALAKQGAASAQQRDQTVAAAKAMAATVDSDQAAINLAQMNLGYATIRSPVTGQTGPVLIQTGNLVTANGTNPLVVINQIQPVKVSFSLPQTDLPRIQDQMRANLLTAVATPHGAGGTSETAQVDFVGNAVNTQTGTIELRATYNNVDFRLVPGQLVDVAVALQTLSNVPVVPRNAVNAGPTQSYVFTVDKDSKAHMVPVTVLYDDGTNDAVKGDLKAGDQAVTEGQLRVISGAAVRIARQGRGRTRGPAGAE